MITVPRSLFTLTMSGLRNRSDGWRESGAIWAGHVTDEDVWVAEEVYFHHELCDDSGRPFSMELTADAKFQLYEELRRRSRRLVGVVHTHPDHWVGLSPADESNQICSRVGFWSIVVSYYGQRPWNPTTMGVHMRTDTGWARVPRSQIRNRLVIT
jgi:proteasome lid subunit RPN8/RPN11